MLERIASFGGEIFFGAPTHCPECGRFGLVDRVWNGRQTNRCASCNAHWAFSEHALSLFMLAPSPDETEQDESRTIIGSGELVMDLRSTGWLRTTRERFAHLKDVLDSRDPSNSSGRR